jgi:hypothetical protein
VRALWWDGEFSYRERPFMDPDEFDGYIRAVVEHELAERPMPAPTPEPEPQRFARATRLGRGLRRLRAGE